MIATVFIGMWSNRVSPSFTAEHYFVTLAKMMLFMMWKENRELRAIVSDAKMSPMMCILPSMVTSIIKVGCVRDKTTTTRYSHGLSA